MKLLDRVRSLFATPPRPAAPTAPVVGEVDAMDRWLVPIATRLTMDDLRGYLQQAHLGELRFLSAFYAEMRASDAHLDGELRKAEAMLAQNPLEVVPFPAEASGAEESAAEEIAEYVRQQLTDPDVRLAPALEALAGGLWAGVAGLQVIVEPGAAEKGREKLLSLSPVLPERFTYVIATNVLGVQTTKEWSSVVPVEDLGASLVVLVGDGHVASPARRGVLRRCLVPWMVKRYGLDWWARFVELVGIPVRVGKYRPGDEETRQLLEETLASSGNAAYLAIPDVAELEFVDGRSVSSQGDSVHEKLVDYAERAISKAVLGATQTSDVRPGAGSKASADVHMDVVETFAEAYATRVCEALRLQLVRPLVARNFGDEAAARHTPVLRLRVKANDDLLLLAQGVEKLVGVGLKVPTGWVYERTGIPWPVEGEEVLEKQEPPALPGVPGGQPPYASSPAQAGEGEDEEAFTAATLRTAVLPAVSPALRRLEAKGERLARGAGEDLVAPYRDLIDQAVAENLDANTLSVRVLHRARTVPPATRSLADLLAAVELEAIAAGVAEARAERRAA